jgi:NMD protein affecting ribosome stability and mRNA decay
MGFSKFKKTCFECGKKAEKLKENLCQDCFKEKISVIEEIKPINIKFCNMCKKIHYNNSLIELEEFKILLPNIVKKHLKINPNYKIEKIEIENFELDGVELDFDVKIISEIKN